MARSAPLCAAKRQVCCVNDFGNPSPGVLGPSKYTKRGGLSVVVLGQYVHHQISMLLHYTLSVCRINRCPSRADLVGACTRITPRPCHGGFVKSNASASDVTRRHRRDAMMQLRRDCRRLQLLFVRGAFPFFRAWEHPLNTILASNFSP